MNFDFGRSNLKNMVKLLYVSKQFYIKKGELSVNRHKIRS